VKNKKVKIINELFWPFCFFGNYTVIAQF